MAEDIFKILLNQGKKKNVKESKDRMETLLDSEEVKTYNDDEEKTELDKDTENEDDFHIGEEKDVPNYMEDVEKLSMRDLDKKPTKQQLKTLKMEYNRVYEKLKEMNDQIVAADRENNDLVLEIRENEKQVRNLKTIFRNLINYLPGNSDLKEIVNTGSWKKDDILPYLEDAIDNIVSRFHNVDQEIEKETQKLQSENDKLKEQVMKYKKIANKVFELEDIINQKQSAQPLRDDLNQGDTPQATKDSPQSDSKEQAASSDEGNNNEQDANKGQSKVSKHNAHFSNFFSDFENASEDKSQTDTGSTSESSNKYSEGSNEKDANHPLSPDFVETEKQDVSELFDGNLSSYLNNISDDQEFILKIIGETGISRNPDLRDYLSGKEIGKRYMKSNKFDYQRLSSDVSELRAKNILKDEKVGLGGKGGGSNIVVYELSDIGKQCYKHLFNDNPVVPEKQRIIDLHASLEHGYLIKDSSIIFKELGYKVYTELADVTVYTEKNQRKVFDFIIETQEGKKQYIEVERGTHNKQDFFNAMDKIYKITNDFYFICPSDNVKNKQTKQMFFSWITERLGGIKNADVILNMTTITQLRKKPKNIWETTDLQNVGH